METNKSIRIQFIYIIYSLVVTLSYAFNAQSSGLVIVSLGIMYWSLGWGLGYFIYSIDRLLDIYINNPQSQLAVTIKTYLEQKKFSQAWAILNANVGLQKKLVFRSVIFQLIWVVLAFFTITSSDSFFGYGMIMGLGLRILLDEWSDYMYHRAFLKQWLFWQINRDFSDREVKNYLVFVTFVFGCLTLLLTYRV